MKFEAEGRDRGRGSWKLERGQQATGSGGAL